MIFVQISYFPDLLLLVYPGCFERSFLFHYVFSFLNISSANLIIHLRLLERERFSSLKFEVNKKFEPLRQSYKTVTYVLLNAVISQFASDEEEEMYLVM